MIELTHVGSLPFLELEQAMSYTFQYDLPVLFTLPQKDKDQFMSREIFSLTSRDRPFFFDAFLSEAKKREVTRIKYQMIGPVSLKRLTAEKEFNLNNYKKCLCRMIKVLLQHFDLVFALDEPMLNNPRKKEFDLLLDVRDTLDSLGVSQSYIHSCQKLNHETLDKLQGFTLNLDHSLYCSNELGRVTRYIAGIELFSGVQDGLTKDLLTGGALTPSCGLALKTIEECHDIYNNLQKCKQFISN